MNKCKIINDKECKFARLFKEGLQCEIQANKYGQPINIDEMFKKKLTCAITRWEKETGKKLNVK